MLAKLDHETQNRDEHKKIFELPPPRMRLTSVLSQQGDGEVKDSRVI